MASSRHLTDPSTSLCAKQVRRRRYVWNWFIEGLRDEISRIWALFAYLVEFSGCRDVDTENQQNLGYIYMLRS